MFVYNVTIQVQDEIARDWLTWLKQEHVPEVLQTGCFESARIQQILDTDEAACITYTVQYVALSKALYNRYIDKYAADMRQKSFDKWGNQFIAYRSVMLLIEEMCINDSGEIVRNTYT